MKRTRFAFDGIVEKIDTIQYSVDSMFVEDGQTWYHFNPDRNLSIRSDGVHLSIGLYKVLWRRYPAKVGDTSDLGSIFLHVIQKTAHQVSVIVAVDTSITVPAGTFKCVAYQTWYYDDNYVLVPDYDVVYMYTEYYAPGVGFVLIEQYDSDQILGGNIFLQFRKELIHATLH
jgi:hypothetical protein